MKVAVEVGPVDVIIVVRQESVRILQRRLGVTGIVNSFTLKTNLML